jgi:quinol monooxygenase YgiN
LRAGGGACSPPAVFHFWKGAKAMSSPVKITGILTAQPGKAEELRMLLTAMVPHCRAEPANLRWDIWEDMAQPGRYILDELYEDEAGVAAHKATPHYQDYLARIGGLADRNAMALRPVAVAGV